MNDGRQLACIQYHKFLRKMQLVMNMFNWSTSAIIFAHKLLCLLAGIVGMYFLVRLVFLQPLVTVMFIVLLFNAFSFYNVMWGNVSVIPDTMDRLKNRLSWNSRNGGSCIARRLIKSVPSVAVKVGNFRSMERVSTLLFVDFVGRNTAAMLISF